MNITCKYNQSAFVDLENRLVKQSRSIRELTEKLLETLAQYGAHDAQIHFTAAICDGVIGAGMNDVEVSAISKDSLTWVIRASGKDVCFIEFGSGIYYNPNEHYVLPRPAGIVGIGEFGKGLGKNEGWFYRDMNGRKVYTHGSPTQMPMYYATEEIKRIFAQTARGIFYE